MVSFVSGVSSNHILSFFVDFKDIVNVNCRFRMAKMKRTSYSSLVFIAG